MDLQGLVKHFWQKLLRIQPRRLSSKSVDQNWSGRRWEKALNSFETSSAWQRRMPRASCSLMRSMRSVVDGTLRWECGAPAVTRSADCHSVSPQINIASLLSLFASCCCHEIYVNGFFMWCYSLSCLPSFI